jgi:pimeloyl-ACP methyl ester carboxylesterase
MHVLYLHGFASSAQSSKAAFLSAKLAGRGIPLITPDFNQPDFEHLTVTRMVDQVLATLSGLPADRGVMLVGSSLGAYVALAVARVRAVSALVLLAPAIEFSADRLARVVDRTVEDWRRSGTTQVFHYGFGRTMSLGFAIYEDVANRPAPVPPNLPTLIFQGRQDTVVDPLVVERWAASRPGTVRLVMLDDDHQLAASLDVIWDGIAGLLPPAISPAAGPGG